MTSVRWIEDDVGRLDGNLNSTFKLEHWGWRGTLACVSYPSAIPDPNGDLVETTLPSV